MFTSITDFLNTWKQESDLTLQLLNVLTDESLQKPAGLPVRTVGTLCNHLNETLAEMPHKLGLRNDDKFPRCTTAKDLVNTYQTLSSELETALRNKWLDATLDEECNMYGEMWKNKVSLQVLVMHQAHHRGQLTILMRLAGLKVPGIYGPAKEEWAQFNMEAPE